MKQRMLMRILTLLLVGLPGSVYAAEIERQHFGCYYRWHWEELNEMISLFWEVLWIGSASLP